MALFGRRKKGGGHGSEAQLIVAAIGAVPPLTEADMGWLVERWVAGMRAGGVTIRNVDSDGSLTGSNGRDYYLDNLAQTLAQLPRNEWEEAVAGAVRSSLVPFVKEGSLGPEELARSLYPRVTPLDSFTPEMMARADWYGPAVAPGLALRACLDTPESVQQVFSAKTLAPLGGWDAVYPRLLENLRALRPAPAHTLSQVDGALEGIHSWESHLDDYFGATRVLLLDELLAEVGCAPGPAGTLVSMPTRHSLMVHVLRDRQSLLKCLGAMVRVTPRLYGEGPGPVSPFVYHRPGPEFPWQQLNERAEDGRMAVMVRGRFAESLAELDP
ncbi:MAG: hypothetical protein LBC97_03395 [Bifidobacteriaceae bacterium]|jgi:hypothetical protein|nr:hypothetical protein [Bifidobacteriaceae bacterium]